MSAEPFRRGVLESLGATPETTDEILVYGENRFADARDGSANRLPLADEPAVETWREYAESASEIGVFAELRKRLVQFRFPIREGSRGDAVYRAATLRGIAPDPESHPPEEGLELEASEGLRLEITPTPAGHVPVLVTDSRADFVSLIRALAGRNEPVPVPASQGACMITGLPNWDRIHRHRARWESTLPSPVDEARWREEFQRLTKSPERYQDRLMILWTGPYSGLPAAAVGLEEDAWREQSLVIRREHEATHYLTKRLFDSMRNNLLDELIADYSGIAAAAGRYRADWALAFLGLESYPSYREGARLENYHGDPPLSDEALAIVHTLVYRAARNLEAMSIEPSVAGPGIDPRWRVVLGLTRLTLEELASDEAEARLSAAIRSFDG